MSPPVAGLPKDYRGVFLLLWENAQMAFDIDSRPAKFYADPSYSPASLSSHTTVLATASARQACLTGPGSTSTRSRTLRIDTRRLSRDSGSFTQISAGECHRKACDTIQPDSILFGLLNLCQSRRTMKTEFVLPDGSSCYPGQDIPPCRAIMENVQMPVDIRDEIARKINAKMKSRTWLTAGVAETRCR